MTFCQEIEQIISKITYKPGWTFKVFDSIEGHVVILISYTALDARDPSKEIRLCQQFSFQRVLQPLFSRQQFYVNVVMEQVRQMEFHEVREWFKYDGQLVAEPHPENVTRR